MAKKNSKQKNANTLRIIGGCLRGRSIDFPDSPGLRPTGDRVRETLFNWLQVDLPESRCLDLYAGSGALGFEALSRGASHVVMVEHSAKVAATLSITAQKLEAGERLKIQTQSALDFIAHNQQSFAVIFLDPPFESELHRLSIEALKKADWLANGTLLYVECPLRFDIRALMDPDWIVLREKTAGQVMFMLLRI